MKIHVSKKDTLKSIQTRFHEAYPFLKLEFFKCPGEGLNLREKLSGSLVVEYLYSFHSHSRISIRSTKTVAKLEDDFYKKLGLNVQVIRKSLSNWIETTRTNSWTLKRQNEEGKLSEI